MKTTRIFLFMALLVVGCGTDETPPTPASGGPLLPAPTVAIAISSAGGIYASANAPAITASVSSIPTATTLTVFQVFRNPGCSGDALAQTTVPASGSPLTAQGTLSVAAPSANNYFSVNYYFIDSDSGAMSGVSLCSLSISSTNSGNPDAPVMIMTLNHTQLAAHTGESNGTVNVTMYDFRYSGRTSPYASIEAYIDYDCGLTDEPFQIPLRDFDWTLPTYSGVADENGRFDLRAYADDPDGSVGVYSPDVGLIFPQPLSIRAVQVQPGGTAILKSECVRLPTTIQP